MSFYYQLYEATHASMSPFRAYADTMRLYFKNPVNPMAHTPLGRQMAAGFELFERVTRRYGQPEWGLNHTIIDGKKVEIHIDDIWSRPFCRLLNFERRSRRKLNDPKVLIVAPMSGHYATLLRGTVEAFLPDHDVYITDWIDARLVPMSEGQFNLDTYIDYLIEILHFLGENTHIIGVCQPAVPVIAATAIMEALKDPCSPTTMTLMGGPIDSRESPTEVNDLASERGLEWFERNVITNVPFPHAGFMRPVYPGFLQLSGFMSMNLDRHISAHHEFFQHLVEGDGDSAEKHREFYDEYLAVMDITAEFFLQTVDSVFIKYSLPLGKMTHRSLPVDLKAIENTALLTIEGENDDITGGGQTKAAQKLCKNIPASRKSHYTQPKVGHYGVFNGSRFRTEIQPRIAKFIRNFDSK